MGGLLAAGPGLGSDGAVAAVVLAPLPLPAATVALTPPPHRPAQLATLTRMRHPAEQPDPRRQRDLVG